MPSFQDAIWLHPVQLPLQSRSTHFSPGSREQAQDSCSLAPLWSEKPSHSYGLSEEQACEHEDQPEP